MLDQGHTVKNLQLTIFSSECPGIPLKPSSVLIAPSDAQGHLSEIVKSTDSLAMYWIRLLQAVYFNRENEEYYNGLENSRSLLVISRPYFCASHLLLHRVLVTPRVVRQLNSAICICSYRISWISTTIQPF